MWFVFGCSSDGSYSDYRPAQAKTGVFDRCVHGTLFLCTVRNMSFILSSIHIVSGLVCLLKRSSWYSSLSGPPNNYKVEVVC